jgi:hypothetical protein
MIQERVEEEKKRKGNCVVEEEDRSVFWIGKGHRKGFCFCLQETKIPYGDEIIFLQLENCVFSLTRTREKHTTLR